MSAPGPTRAAIKTRDDWETPPELFYLLDREFDFKLDAAATYENRKCADYFGPGSPICEDAFKWEGSDREPISIFINPPYGRAENPCVAPCKKKTCPKRGHCLTEYRPGMDDWTKLLADWAEHRHTIVDLVPNATETTWFAEAKKTAAEIRLLTGRIEYVGGEGGNTGGSALIIWRPGPKPLEPHIWVWDWRADL